MSQHRAFSLCLMLLCFGLVSGGCTPVSQGGAADMGVPDLVPGDVDPCSILSVSATARLNPNMTVEALIDVLATGADSVDVSYGDLSGYGLDHQTIRFPVHCGSITIPILGLTPNAQAHFLVTAYGPNGVFKTSKDLFIQAPPFPTELPRASVVVPLILDPRFALVSVARNGASFALMLDRSGRVMWYREGGASDRGLDFRRAPNGNFTFYSGGARSFDELDLAGNPVRAWGDPAAALGADGHRLILVPDAGAMLLGWGVHNADTTGLVDGGAADGAVYDNSVDEVSPDGGLIARFSTVGVIGLDETLPPALARAGNPIDALHPVSVDIAADGDVVVGLANAGSVIKVGLQGAAVRWRLGGVKSDFTFEQDPLGGLSMPLDARILANGDVLVFDRAATHNPPLSRVVQYQLDLVNHKAKWVWQARHMPDLDAAGGNASAERLGDGNTIIAWGDSGTVSELDASGKTLWEITLPGVAVSASRVSTIYP